MTPITTAETDSDWFGGVIRFNGKNYTQDSDYDRYKFDSRFSRDNFTKGHFKNTQEYYQDASNRDASK